jgi:multiple sugar transport system permease protein
MAVSAQPASVRAPEPARRWSKVKVRNNKMGYVFVAPLVLGVLAFAIYPMFAALYLSFNQTSGATLNGKWVGLSNYRYALNDPIFWKSLYNTLYMGILSVSIGIIVSFILASMINSVKWVNGKNMFKGIFFLPNVISAVASTLLFSFLFYPTKQGLLNFVLGFLHIDPVGWFTDPRFSQISIVLMSLWGALGYNTIIFIAGLQSVPRDLYEAAEVDGAAGLKKWWYITIPYMRPIFVFMIVMGTIGSMKRFTDVWLIGGTAGNPSGTLLTSVLYIYRNAFLAAQMGLASASSYLLFFVILILTVLLLRLSRKKDSFD